MPRIKRIKNSYKIQVASFILWLIIFGFGFVHAEEFKVGMKNWEFNPQNLTVKVGDAVLWINDDDSHHTVTFEAQSIKSSENIKPERQFSITFEKTGEYKYYCKYHRDNGMKGVIIVR